MGAPSKWDRHATRAAKALLREEGKALRDLRAVARAASQRIVHATVLLPPGDRRQTAERLAAMLRAEGERVAREMTAAVSGVRLASKTTSHGLLVAEWADVRHELRKAGYRDPGGLGTHPTLAPTDDASAHRTGQSFAAGWTSLILAAAWTWAEGTAESIAPTLATVDVDGRVRRISATEAAQSFADARDESAGWLAEEYSDRPWYPLVLKRWDATNDRKVCPTCKGEDGEKVLLGATFSEGHSPGYAHSFCRCIEHLVVLPIPGRRELVRAGRQVDDTNPRGPDEVPIIEAA
jgi:hypothetical protein